VGLALKFVVQNGGDFMDVILLYNWHLSVSTPVDRFGISNVEPVVLQFCVLQKFSYFYGTLFHTARNRYTMKG